MQRWAMAHGKGRGGCGRGRGMGVARVARFLGFVSIDGVSCGSGGYGVKGSERVSERQEGSRFISANFTSYDEGNVVRRWGGLERQVCATVC